MWHKWPVQNGDPAQTPSLLGNTRIALHLNQSLLQDWQSAMLKKEIIKNLQENKLPGNSRLCPLVWAFVPRASVVSTRALGTHAFIICFIASALRFDYTGQPPCSWALSDTSQHLILQGRQWNPFLPTAAFCCGQWWFMNTPLCCSIGALLCSWKTCVCPNTDIRVSCSLKNNLIMHQGHFSELVI